jgi:hypothetical protein
MKRYLLVVLAVLCFFSAVGAAAVSPLTTVRQVRELSNAQARQGLPVAFEATVSYIRWYEGNLFVQDGDAAIFVLIDSTFNLIPGDRVLVEGTTAGSFHPIVNATKVSLLHHGIPPAPQPASFQQLITAQRDCQMVSAQGVVLAANMVISRESNAVRSIQLQLQGESGRFTVNLDSEDSSLLQSLLDATVEVIGVAAGKFDDKMDLTGAVVYVSQPANIRILARAQANPWSVPLTPIDQILSVYNVHNLTPRVRVQGTLTYYRPGLAVV